MGGGEADRGGMKVMAPVLLLVWIVAGSAWLLGQGDGRGLEAAAFSLGLRAAPEAGTGADVR